VEDPEMILEETLAEVVETTPETEEEKEENSKIMFMKSFLRF
jgi:hypothetical protein